MENNWKIGAIAGLDGTQSRNQLNSDIKGLSRNLDKLKLYAEIDKNQVTQLQQQLKKLQVELNNVTVNDAVINGLVAKINAGLQNINIGNINVGNVNTQAQQACQQIGNNIAQGVASGVSKAKSELKSFSDLTNFSDLNKKIEHLQIDPSALKNYNTILDEVKAKYAEFGQVKITNEQFDNGILEKFKVNIEQVNGDLKETKSFMMSLNADKDTFVFDGIIKGSENIVQHLDTTKNAVNQTADAINALKDKAKSDKIQHSLNIGDYDVQLKTFETALKKAGIEGTELENKLNGVKTSLNALRTSATGDNIIPSTVVENARLLDVEIEKISNDIKNIKLDNSLLADNIRVNDTITKLNEQLRKNYAYSNEAKEKIEAWIKELENGNVAVARLKEINSEAKALHHQMASMGKVGKSFWQTLTSGWQKFAEWTIATTSFMDVIQAFKALSQNVVVLEDKLLELNKVSDLTAEGLAKITEQAYNLGDTVGKTGTQTLDAITAYKRAGFDLAESIEKAEDALKMVNVAEGINEASESAEYLIAIMKGYEDTSNEFSQKILDSINEVSNTQSVNFDSLADGSRRLSAVANQAGVSFDQMLGVLTGGYEVLGNMEKTASGLITIFTRLQSIQLADEEEVESIAKLQKTFSGATNGKVNIVDQTTGQLRGAYDILNDLNKVWKDLDKNTQEGLAFAAGGTRQKSVFLSIMSNWESVEKSVLSASESMGSAEIENQKYLDSISGKISIFKSAVEKLSNTLLDSNILKFFIDLGIVGVKSIDGIVNAITPLTLAIGGGAFAIFKNVDYLKMPVCPHHI